MVPLVKVKVMPLKTRLERLRAFVPAFFNSTNSNSSPLVKPAGSGLYMISVSESFVRSWGG
jgi:hypothetical protein